MMAATMLPASAPAIGAGIAESSEPAVWWRQWPRPIATVIAYLGVWTLAGALAYLALRAGRSVAGGLSSGTAPGNGYVSLCWLAQGSTSSRRSRIAG
jgi:hypothetical protein